MILKNTYFQSMKIFIDVDYVFQELDVLPEGLQVPEGRVKPWGTGHAVLVAEPQIKEPFAVINADDFYGKDSFKAIAIFSNSPLTRITNKHIVYLRIN
jgi:UTP-glucose-1-phosphate uridylyltransferase